MNIIPIKAVFFDCDGVIADTMGDHAEAWVRAFRDHGIEINGKWVFEYEGAPFRDVAREFFRRCGVQPDGALLETVALDKERHFGKMHCPSIYSGILPILGLLRKRGIPFGLVTGASRLAIARTLPNDVLGQFSVVVTGDDVERGKPHPDPYLKAAQLLSINPQECIVIENGVFGIRSAKAAGMRCIALQTTLDATYLMDADIVLKGHVELELTFKNLFSIPPPISPSW
ncbi:MAG: hypothetical protein COX62_07520 [Deltaproteobacteria bacterium CG_4_10_14_0_2_um_filter_43_8]|nr:MAG: hypothetical protein COV46_03320 [Deltaproteobacteria bacterium CG11_big_fil_rev_8_21_14_0_20_49_13]PJA19011.1 MAG: hypothetical protein COX62_07520 [Deltaproteobacteria bacterium CG_4_10_14_0_2_um_filter_43_8]